jgi:hypothetical protein
VFGDLFRDLKGYGSLIPERKKFPSKENFFAKIRD